MCTSGCRATGGLCLVGVHTGSVSAEGHGAGDWLPRGPLGHLIQELPGLSALSGEQL